MTGRAHDRDDDGRVSLHPLTFEEAMKALLETPPAKPDSKGKRRARARDADVPDEQGCRDGEA